jgi:hypothetical protein
MRPEDNYSLTNLGNGKKLRPLNPLDLNISSYIGVSPLKILLKISFLLYLSLLSILAIFTS